MSPSVATSAVTTPSTTTHTRRPALRALPANTTTPDTTDPLTAPALVPAPQARSGSPAKPNQSRRGEGWPCGAAADYLWSEVTQLSRSKPVGMDSTCNPLDQWADHLEAFATTWVTAKRLQILKMIEAGDGLDTPTSKIAIQKIRLILTDMVRVLSPALRDDA